MNHEETEQVMSELSGMCRELLEHSRQQARMQREMLCWLSALTLHCPDKQQVLLTFQMVAEGIPEADWTVVRQTLQQAVEPSPKLTSTLPPAQASLRLVKDEAP